MPNWEHSFWRGTLQNAIGCLIAALVITIGSLLIGYARARQMSASLVNGFYISVLVMGVCIVVLGLYLMGVWINGRFSKSPAQTEPRPQNLTIRILEAYFGVAPNANSTQVLLVRVRVDGLATKIKGWGLNLERDRKPWKVAYQQPLLPKKFIRFVPGIKGLVDVEHCIPLSPDPPLDPLVPSDPSGGWLHFTVETVDAHFTDLLRGATFIFVAVEEAGDQSRCKEFAAEWLQPAIIVTY